MEYDPDTYELLTELPRCKGKGEDIKPEIVRPNIVLYFDKSWNS